MKVKKHVFLGLCINSIIFSFYFLLIFQKFLIIFRTLFSICLWLSNTFFFQLSSLLSKMSECLALYFAALLPERKPGIRMSVTYPSVFLMHIRYSPFPVSVNGSSFHTVAQILASLLLIFTLTSHHYWLSFLLFLK